MTIELPPEVEQTEFNLRRWAELLDDPELAKLDARIETDRHGQIIMSPPPAPKHGRFQVKIALLLEKLLPHGETMTECPISTADGVKAVDVAWASAECIRQFGGEELFSKLPGNLHGGAFAQEYKGRN